MLAAGRKRPPVVCVHSCGDGPEQQQEQCNGLPAHNTSRSPEADEHELEQAEEERNRTQPNRRGVVCVAFTVLHADLRSHGELEERGEEDEGQGTVLAHDLLVHHCLQGLHAEVPVRSRLGHGWGMVGHSVLKQYFSGAVGQCGVFEQFWVLSKNFPSGPHIFPTLQRDFPTKILSQPHGVIAHRYTPRALARCAHTHHVLTR